MPKPFGLSRSEKLKSRKQIDALFAGKQRFSVYPLQVWWRFLPADDEGSVQIGVTCSKRHFKKAVDRNRVKRLIREAYRLQKVVLSEALPAGKQAQLFFVYLDKALPAYDTVFAAMTTCLQTLKKKCAHEPVV
ncbi:MAG: rnpA [Flaviaesturariibacter sp.]|nr:rnpA [Flaviaesturariibacter sp.]